VLEKSHFPRAKLCGEFLGPDGLEALAKLGCLDFILEQSFGPVVQATFYPQRGWPTHIPMLWVHRAYPFGVGIGREQLDTLLAEVARRRGVWFEEGCRVLPDVMRERRGFWLSYLSDHGLTSEPSRTDSLFARILIDATGRHGRLAMPAGAFFTRNRSADWIGIQFHVRLRDPSAVSTLEMFLFPGGYGGIQPLPDGIHNVCMLAPAPLAKRVREPLEYLLAESMARNNAAAERLMGAERIGPVQTTASINLSPGRLPESEHLLRVGDAVVTVDPFTGSGMSLALQTGILAAEVIARGFRQGWTYEAMCRTYYDEYERFMGRRLRMLGLLRPILSTSFSDILLGPVGRPFHRLFAHAFR
jgi:flavin-dependent dehydrogenase